jgi:hypothetical protein
MKPKTSVIVGSGRSMLLLSLIGLMTLVTAFSGLNSAYAQSSPSGGVFKISYFDVSAITGAGDNEVRIVNPTRANGNLCAMIYVFDHQQELQECCGCPLTPNDLLDLSVENDLTHNPWGRSGLQDGVIEVVSARPNHLDSSCSTALGCVGGCDPTQIYAPTPTLNAWITHVEDANGANTATAATASFASAIYDQVEKNNLINLCQFIVSGGSGGGVCSCGPKFSPPK